ncbi:MAG: methylenetetrahydrofolate reductase [Candidatus Ratteibacteria bacterium]
MPFKEKLQQKKFVVTSEVGPPKGVAIDPYLNEAEELKDKVDAFNVTDLQSSVMRLGSLAVSHLLYKRGLEPIFQITCRDRNRLALQSDLLSAWVLGIRNVLVLTGDHPVLGDHPDAKPVFDLDSVSLLSVLSGLMEGTDMKGNSLEGTPDFFAGAVVNPGSDPIEPQLYKMEAKLAAGARFFQTQAIYDLDIFERFMKKAESFHVPILGGIVLLKSAGMAKFMNEKVAGISVPNHYIQKMAQTKKEERPGASIEIATELIKGMKSLCAGIHIMPLGWEQYVPELLRQSGI